MRKLFRAEVDRLLHNKAFLIMLALIVIFSVIYGYTGYQRAHYAFYVQTRMPGMIFLNAMGDLFLPPFFSVFAALCIISGGFTGKNARTELYCEHSRAQLYFVKAALYFACVLFLSMLVPLCAFLYYEASYFASDWLPLDYMLRCIGQRIVCDLTIAAVPLLIAFLLRDYIKTGVISLLYAAALYYIGLDPGIPSVANPFTFFYSHLPTAAAPYIMQKFPQPDPRWLPHTMLLCAGIFLVCIVAGYLVLRKAKLKKAN